jgi:hypothetical protein
MRRFGLSVVLAAVLVLGFGAFVVPAGAGSDGEQGTTTFIIRKVVNGPATAGSTVVVDCEGETATLTFDATGAPNTTSSNSFVKANGAWVLDTNLPPDLTACTYTETVTGGAVSTSWTCAYESTEPDEPKALPQGLEDPDPGCAAAAGTGTGPVTVVYGNLDDNVASQTSTVTFTNTYVAPPPPPPVVTGPSFTG